MAPKFEVISGGMDTGKQKNASAFREINPKTKVIPHGNPNELLACAKTLRQELSTLTSKSDEECSAILHRFEGNWVNIADTPEGPIVLYKDLKEHNGKLVRNRLREILESKIERLERDAKNILEHGYVTP